MNLRNTASPQVMPNGRINCTAELLLKSLSTSFPTMRASGENELSRRRFAGTNDSYPDKVRHRFSPRIVARLDTC